MSQNRALAPFQVITIADAVVGRVAVPGAREDELSGPCASPPCELDLSLHPAYLADLPPSSTQPHVSRNARAYATSHAYRSSSLDRSPTVGHAAHGDADSWILPLSKPPPSSSSSSTASQLGDGAHARRMMGIRGPRTSPSTENAQAKLVPPLISPLRTRLPLLLDPSVELHPSYRTGTPTIQDPSPPVLSQASRTQPVTPSAMSSLATPRHRASPRSTPAPIPRLVASPPPLKLPVLPRRVTELQPDRQTPPHQCPQVAEGVPSFLHTPPRSDGHPRPTLSASSAPSGPRQPRVDVAAVQQALANLLTSPPPPPSVVVDLKTAADPSEPSSPAFRDLAWSLYAELGDDKLPRSLLPLLFNSQRDGPDASERARRLLRIFRDAAQDEPLSSSGETPKWWLSLRQLEETLEAGLEMVEVSAPASTTSMGVAILLREVWRTITTVDGTPSAGPRQGFLSYARRDELLWRWIGITVPRAEGDGHFLHHVPPVEPTTRVAQLARFLWCVGPSSPAGIRAFASTFVAGRTDATLVDEIESAVVRTCDARATRLKRGKFSDEDLAAAEALEADPSRDGDDLAIRDGTEVGSWVLDMVSRLPTVAADASRWAPALAHRSATSILLLSHLERRLTRDVCPVQATHIVASIVRLRALPPTFHVPVEDLQLFASTLLNAYPKLDILETEPLYHLLEAFIHGGHFAFSMRLYELLRAREREFIVPGELVIQLLRLAMEGETSTWAGPGLYVDYSAWGNEALEHADLLRFVQTIGARPQQGGMMLRAVAESLICYGDEIVTDELVIAIVSAWSHLRHIQRPRTDFLRLCPDPFPRLKRPTPVSLTLSSTPTIFSPPTPTPSPLPTSSTSFHTSAVSSPPLVAPSPSRSTTSPTTSSPTTPRPPTSRAQSRPTLR